MYLINLILKTLLRILLCFYKMVNEQTQTHLINLLKIITFVNFSATRCIGQNYIKHLTYTYIECHKNVTRVIWLNYRNRKKKHERINYS